MRDYVLGDTLPGDLGGVEVGVGVEVVDCFFEEAELGISLRVSFWVWFDSWDGLGLFWVRVSEVDMEVVGGRRGEEGEGRGGKRMRK